MYRVCCRGVRCVAMQRQTALTHYLKSEQLLQFAFAVDYTPMKCRAKASSSNCLLEKKRLLLFVFELQDSLLPSSTGILTAVQRKTAVTAHLKSKQLLLFFFAGSCSFTQIKRSKSMPSRPRLLFPCKMTPAHWPDHQCFLKVCNLVCLNATSGGVRLMSAYQLQHNEIKK